MNIGATTHMINDTTQLDKTDTYTSKDCVIVSNGASLLIYNIGTLSHPLPYFKRCLRCAWLNQKSDFNQ
jgi:hypothetical protein